MIIMDRLCGGPLGYDRNEVLPYTFEAAYAAAPKKCTLDARWSQFEAAYAAAH
jgi:hypothetical protein